ncbi:MAG: DUF2490 domain-containing protein [Gammaproteobacteria bacterium]|jgi:hypothetical protein
MTIRRSVRKVLTGIVFAACCVATQRSHAADDDIGAWAIFSATNSITRHGEATRWHYGFDAQARYFDFGSGANQWLVRPSIGYELDSGVRLWVGYARLRSRSRTGRTADENRYWQQIDWPARQWLNGQVTMRARLEQRSVSIGQDLGLELRFMTRYVRPLAGTGEKNLVLSIEPFMNFRDTDWSGKSRLSQNRTFVGVGWRAGTKLTMEAGYMNQYFWFDQSEDQSNHLAVLTFKTQF